MSLELALKSVH